MSRTLLKTKNEKLAMTGMLFAVGIVIRFLVILPVIMFFRHDRKKVERNMLLSAINLISQGTASCVVIKDNTIVRTELERGIGPVIKLYEEGMLEGAFVVDRIVGKASAMILTLGGVKACYGMTMSRKAYQWLVEHGVQVNYGTKVEAIINRSGDGVCPMELTVQAITDEKEALAAVKKRVEELRRAEKERQESL